MKIRLKDVCFANSLDVLISLLFKIILSFLSSYFVFSSHFSFGFLLPEHTCILSLRWKQKH